MDSNMKVPGRNGSMGKISPLLDAIPHTVVSEEKYFEEKYKTQEKLGEGSFGVVYEAIHRESGERCACKIIQKEKAGGHRFQLATREVMLLKKVQHEHIIRLKEVFEIQQKIYLVMELCERGELSMLIRNRGTLSEDEARIVMHRLISAIAYLHKQGLVHRDLKLENILLSNNPNDPADDFYIKVTDFGLSIKKAGNTADDMMDEFCGTPMYMAPEILENKTYSEKCDVWAMGISMCILLTGVPPFQGESDLRTANIKLKFAEKEWTSISVAAKDCIERMLILDPAPRMTASELLDHPWIKGIPLDSHAQGPRNVLEMMKEYRKENEEAAVAADLTDSSERSLTINHKANAGKPSNTKSSTTVRTSTKNMKTGHSSVNHSRSQTSSTDPNHSQSGGSPATLGSKAATCGKSASAGGTSNLRSRTVPSGETSRGSTGKLSAPKPATTVSKKATKVVR